jgi:glycosyltransferase involved in cell wall biosynthesis
MKIAIHAADLDHCRIDGTRVYLLHMLNQFGVLNQQDSFAIYHQSDFNPNLTPTEFENYHVKQLSAPFLWTQTAFATKLLLDKPDVLWMPVHNMPIVRRKSLKTVVTIHDLAFKIFPDYFPEKDLRKLNMLSDLAIKNANRIIAVSEATKKDIIRFYPMVDPESITVVYHGFDGKIFQDALLQQNASATLGKFKLESAKYLLYVGAIQPRKNLEVLIEAFEKIKISNPELKMVFAGAPAWKFEATMEKIRRSKFRKDIIITGTVGFSDLAVLYKNAEVFVFPSLYEGFGIPVLEAMACGTPVVVAKNSSLTEVAGEGALYFETQSSDELMECVRRILHDDQLRRDLIEKGFAQAKNFSWEKCASETLDIILKW